MEALGAHVVGVSGDKATSQLKFIEKYGLTYPMIPDTEKEIISAYGVRALMGLAAKRSTFLIDPQGRVARTWPSVKLSGHVEDVVATLRSLQA